MISLKCHIEVEVVLVLTLIISLFILNSFILLLISMDDGGNIIGEKIERYGSKYVTYLKSIGGDIAMIEVFTLNTSKTPISDYLFGIFVEHYGAKIREGSIYHGIWAEILDNPSFEKAEYFGVALPSEGVAYPWRIYGFGNVSYKLVDGYGIGTAQRIIINHLKSNRVGIQQPIYLPTIKTNEYIIRLWLRGEIPRIIIALEKRNEQPVVEYTILNISKEWKNFVFNITLPQEGFSPCEQLFFTITSDSVGWFDVDHASLMRADNVHGFDPDVVRLLKEMGVTIIRWPGGNFASQYHWKDGIGPKEYRPIKLNRAWNIPEYNYVGTDEFVLFAQLIGAEPLIVINAGWDGTIEEAAEWVEYVNGNVNSTWGKKRAENGHPEPYNVTWWELGNELYGSWQIGHMTPLEYARRYDEFYKAMKTTDPNIRFIANGGPDNIAEAHTSWLYWDGVLLKVNRGNVTHLSRHYLLAAGMSEWYYHQIIGWTFSVRERWKEEEQILREYQNPPPKLAITEAQGTMDFDASATMMEAMWAAGLYNAAIYSDGFVDIITRSSLMWFGGGLRKACEIVYPTPAYYVQKIYARQPGRYPITIRVVTPTFNVSEIQHPLIPRATNVPYIDAVALFDYNKTLLILIVINYHTENIIKSVINLHNYEIYGVVKVIQLSARTIFDRNTWETLNIKPVEYIITPVSKNRIVMDLPPISISCLLINGTLLLEKDTRSPSTTIEPSTLNIILLVLLLVITGFAIGILMKNLHRASKYAH
ncbi:MAG: alpha-L-arabinofuranosidase C-terminal domain-containing protein [Ignisphaera sp.]